MKRNIIIVAALAIAGLCSCQKEDLQTTKNIIDATVEAASDDASKTTLGEDFSLNWASGDQFGVFAKDNLNGGNPLAICSIEEGIGTKNGKFSISPEISVTTNNIAYYPLNNWTKPGTGYLQRGLSSYSLSETNPMPMFGNFKSANAVSFKPLYGVLKFVSKDGHQFSSIKLNFNAYNSKHSSKIYNAKTVKVYTDGSVEYSGSDASFSTDTGLLMVKPFTMSGDDSTRDVVSITVNYSDGTEAITYNVTGLNIECGHIKTLKVQ